MTNPRNRWWLSKPVVARLVELAHAKVSNKKIAETLSREFRMPINHHMIAGKIHRLGIVRGSPKPSDDLSPGMKTICPDALPAWLTPEADDILLRAIAAGVKPSAIATAFGRDQKTIRSRKKRLLVLAGVEVKLPSPPVVVPPPPPVVSLPAFVPPPAPAQGRGVRWTKTCQYPIGDPGTKGFGFCDKPLGAEDWDSYCLEHYRRCYLPVPRRTGG